MKKLLIAVLFILLVLGTFIYYQYNQATSIIKPISGNLVHNHTPNFQYTASTYIVTEPISGIISDYKSKGFLQPDDFGLFHKKAYWPFISKCIITYWDNKEGTYLRISSEIIFAPFSSIDETEYTSNPANSSSSP